MGIFDIFTSRGSGKEIWAFEVLYCPRKRLCGNWVDVSELSSEEQERVRWLRDHEPSRILCPRCREKRLRYYRTEHPVYRFDGFIATLVPRNDLPDYNLVLDRYWEECMREGKPFLVLQANARHYALEYDLTTARRKDGGLPAVSERRWYDEVFRRYAARYRSYLAFSPVRGTLFCLPEKAYEAAGAVLEFWNGARRH